MTHLTSAALTILAKVAARPDPNGLPGSNALEKLVNGLFFWTLLACLAGLLVSVVVWALASRGHNPHHAHNGKLGALLSAAGALVAGAAPAIINFFFGAGQSVH
jgi:hypothetical protein